MYSQDSLQKYPPSHFQEFGVPKSSFNRYLQKIYPLLQSRNISHLQKRVEVGEISPGRVIEIVKLKVGIKKNGRPNYLNEDNQSLLILSAGIEVVPGLPFECHGLAYQLQEVVKASKFRCGDNNILQKSSTIYFQEVIKQANKTEDEHEDQKIRTCTGFVKVSRLINTQSSQSDPRLACIMLHTIDSIYRELKHQETLQTPITIKKIKSPASFSPPQLYQPTEPISPN